MTKRPTSPPDKFRRLTREESARMGISYSSKRRVAANVKRVMPWTAIYTDRRVADIKRERRLGEKTTKEQYQRGVRQGRYRYDNATKTRQVNAKNSRQIREFLPDIAPKDKVVTLKHLDKGYYSLAPAEKERFKEMFRRYPADDVRQALGSAPKEIGRFEIAA